MKKLLLLLSVLFLIICQTEAQVKFYGVASEGGSNNLGTVFHFTSEANSFTLDHFFLAKDGVIGSNPSGGLLDGSNGKYYGVTFGGGLYNAGVLFEWDPLTNAYIKKYDFGQSTFGRLPLGPLTLLNGKLYGVCWGGVIFEWDLDVNNANPYRELINFDYTTGFHPTGTLAVIGTKLYGMTSDGGGGFNGTIFEMDTDPNNTNPFRVIVNFDHTIQGRPGEDGSLTVWDEQLYGMCANGGYNNKGTIFNCDPDPNNAAPFTKLHDFDETNGNFPVGHVTYYNGKLYGTTIYGGTHDNGVLFSFDLDITNPNRFEKLVDFDESTGQYATGKLYESRGILFGTTSSGGANYGGTIFEYDTDPANTSPFMVKVNLYTNNGYSPGSTLLLNNDKFYGVTYRGGLGFSGVIFEWDTTSTNYIKNIDFNFGANGGNPEGNLTQVGAKLYGVTKIGGESPFGGYGTIFEIDTLTGIFTKKQDFGYYNNGFFVAEPRGSLSIFNNKLYGNTRDDIFEWDPGSNIITPKIKLNSINAAEGNGSLTLYKGKFYGMTSNGGTYSQGTLFEWNPSTNVITKWIDFGDGTNGSIPDGGLALYNGKFYGVTLYGGSSNWGILFEWDPLTKAFTSKRDFDGVTTGAFPCGTLAITGNKFYGMTSGGGQGGRGTLYEWDPSANTITAKVDFSGPNGSGPLNSLTVSEGKLYGMTGRGGGSNDGVIFEYDPSAELFNKLTDLDGIKGSVPKGSLLALSSSPRIWFQDNDNDGYSNGNTLTQYESPIGYKLENELLAVTVDCNDVMATVHPGASEICSNGIDDDCDGQVDEGCPILRTWYLDKDGDTYGNPDPRYTKQAAVKPNGYVENALDCKDWVATINPGATEQCDGIDNNCNGQVDEGCLNLRTWYLDKDGDTYGNPDPRYTKQSAVKPNGYVENALDCKDWDATINPGAPEQCDGIDNNCNGQIDEGCTNLQTWYLDKDVDTYGNPDPRYTKQSTLKPNGYVENALDCKDWDATINPGAPELCDGIDNNCNGQVDEGCANLRTWYLDKDGDTFGNPDTRYTKQSAVKPNGYVDNALDCRDWDAAMYPGASELCDGKDNDCNGNVDEACTPPSTTDVEKRVSFPKPFVNADKRSLEVTLWPNPARDVLMVSLDDFDPNKKLEMVLIQADGKAVSAQSVMPVVKGQQVRFDVRKMSAGYHILQVKQGASVQVKKVIIVK